MVPIYGHIAANKRRTFLLFFIFALLFTGIGYGIGLYMGEPLAGLILAVVIFAVLFLISYFGGQGVVTTMAGAKPVGKRDEPYLYNTVEAMSIAAGRPMPKLYIIETDVPNAFAAGRNPNKAVIGVTRGLLKRLNRTELEGVIAHEMAHINNYDVLLATVAIVMAGTIVFAAHILRRSMWFGGMRGGRRGGSRGGHGQLIALLLLIVISILAPLFARLLQFAISRQREFLADATAADLTGYPEGLASALDKISGYQDPKGSLNNQALQGIYIVNPALGARSKQQKSSLYSTHPPTADRIKRLRDM